MIYFIRIKHSSYVKIGYTVSSDVSDSYKALQCQLPFDLELLGTLEGNQEIERRVHQTFEKKRIKGKWYNIEYDLKDFIDVTRLKLQKGEIETPMKESLESKERELICTHLEASKGNYKRTAESLSMPYSTLMRKVSKYGITIQKRVSYQDFLESENLDI